MNKNSKKEITFEDISSEVKNWRKEKPESPKFRSLWTHPINRPGYIITLILFLGVSFSVPIIELVKLICIKPLLMLYHSTVVIIAALILRFKAASFFQKKFIKLKTNEDNGNIYNKHAKGLRFIICLLGPSLKWYLKIDTSDVRSVGKLQEWIGDILGVSGIWIESNLNKAVRKEIWCPIIEYTIPVDTTDSDNIVYKKTCLDYYNKFLKSCLNDIAQYYCPGMTIEATSYILPNGGTYSEIIWERVEEF